MSMFYAIGHEFGETEGIMLWSECLCQPPFHMLKFKSLQVMVLVTGAFGRCLSCPSGALRGKISAL